MKSRTSRTRYIVLTCVMVCVAVLSIVLLPNATDASTRAFVPSKGCFWRQANGVAHRYEIVTYHKDLTWHQADMLASQRTFRGVRGYLATISNGSEDWCVRTAILNLSGLRWPDASGAWIGANSYANAGVFRWASGPEKGTLLNRSVFLWHTHQPDNNVAERCVGYMYRDGWVAGNNYPCDAVTTNSFFRDKMKRFVVEYSARGTILN
jgi:hypothetical protein